MMRTLNCVSGLRCLSFISLKIVYDYIAHAVHSLLMKYTIKQYAIKVCKQVLLYSLLVRVVVLVSSSHVFCVKIPIRLVCRAPYHLCKVYHRSLQASLSLNHRPPSSWWYSPPVSVSYSSNQPCWSAPSVSTDTCRSYLRLLPDGYSLINSILLS